jgi:hypothetical protein
MKKCLFALLLSTALVAAVIAWRRGCCAAACESGGETPA